MSKGLEALEALDYVRMCCSDGLQLPQNQSVEQVVLISDSLATIERELKALEIIKNKKVNIFHIWAFDDYEQYKEHYPFSEYHAEEDMLDFEEFDLLKGILNDEQ